MGGLNLPTDKGFKVFKLGLKCPTVEGSSSLNRIKYNIIDRYYKVNTLYVLFALKCLKCIKKTMCYQIGILTLSSLKQFKEFKLPYQSVGLKYNGDTT